MTGPSTTFWPWLTIGPIVRPSRMLSWDQKDEVYDDNCATYYLGSVYQPYRDFYLREYAANLNMVQNGPSAFGDGQVIREFLGDENNPTGRLRWRYTIIQTMHTRLVGAADNISVSAKATSWTSNVTVRKETAMYDRLLKSQVAQMGYPLNEVMAQQGVSPDEDQEEELHENLWTDPYEVAVTRLITAMGKRQKLARKQRKAASHLALSGAVAIHEFINGNSIEAELCEPEEVGWDHKATRPDFSDGEYCYVARLMDITAIAEQFQPSKDKIRALDKWANQQAAMFNTSQNPAWPQRCPRVFTVYFKDKQYSEWGFVMKDGEPHFCQINKPDPSRRDGKPEYTDADLLPPIENEWTVTWNDQQWKQRKIIKEIQRLRYCTMIPWQYLPGAWTGGPGTSFIERRKLLESDPTAKEILGYMGPTGNMVLESGEYPLQETNPDDKYLVDFPLKFSSWMYMGSMAIAPLSCIRDIQGMMNATLSDMLMRMSRADMPTTVFNHESLVAAGISADEAARNVKKGKAFSIAALGVGGVNQAVTTTDTGLGPEFYNRFAILDKLYQMAQNATGIYDQNFGAPGAEDQLVRVKELQSRQSGIMLQPFFAALGDLFEQVHQFNAQAGKKFFASRPWALKQMVGDEGERVLIGSKEMTDEQFRVEIILTTDAEQRKRDAETMILQEGGYMDRGMLDAREAAKLLSKEALPEDVKRGAAAFTKRMAEVQKAMAAQAQQEQHQMVAAQAQANLDQQETELAKMGVDAGLKQEAMERKSAQPMIQAASEHLKPMEEIGIPATR